MRALAYKVVLIYFVLQTEPAEWRKVFFVASGVYFFTNLFFILFSTSVRQPWNEPKETDIGKQHSTLSKRFTVEFQLSGGIN